MVSFSFMAIEWKQESSDATHTQASALKQADKEGAFLRLRLLAEAVRTVSLIGAARKLCEAAAQAIESTRRTRANGNSLKNHRALWISTTLH